MTQSSNSEMNPRILLVDNDIQARQIYEVLLQHWHYEPVIAQGEGKALIRNATLKAKQERCHLALIDLRLMDDYDEDDDSGLRLALKIGPIRKIILSGNANQKVLLDILANHKDILVINKGESAEDKHKRLEIELRKVSAFKRGVVIEPADLMDDIACTTFKSLVNGYTDQVADILAQLFPRAANLHIEKLDTGTSVAQGSGVPRPNSVVLKVYEDDREPVVVKLARATKIKIEVDNYDKYILGRLSGSFIARLERSVTLWDIGGAVYSYIGDFDVKTFSSYYEEHPLEDIQDCLNTFFTVSWGRHYDKAHDRNDLSLFELYRTVWGDWYGKRVKNFVSRETLTTLVPFGGVTLPQPIDWFKQNIAENREADRSFVDHTRVAITHGDLHGDNLLIDSRKNAWVIDFERTREGHALQDFIELEADILNRLQPYQENSTFYYQMCLLVAGQKEIRGFDENEMMFTDPGIRKALQSISILRSLALKCTGIQDARQYILGLLFNTLFRATINNAEKYRARQHCALILAGIFCHRLEHWNEPWPPEEWKPVLQK
jgi:hypothetical protein